MASVPLPWAAVVVGSSVALPDGRRAVVTAVGRVLGRFREVQLDGSRTKIVDPSAVVRVLFDEESKAMLILISVFPHLQVISRGETP